jgi:hypothetical protein
MIRASMGLVALVAALAAVMHVTQAHARSYTIKTGPYIVTQLGPLKTRSSRTYSPTIGRAINAFGQPSNSFRIRGDGCAVKWRRLGLRIEFFNFGDSGRLSICNPSVGRAQSFTIERSKQWRTWKGLRIGMSEDAVWDRHPNAGWVDDHEFVDDGFWLRDAYSPIGQGGEYPILSAHLRNGDSGRVKSFSGWIGAAGE